MTLGRSCPGTTPAGNVDRRRHGGSTSSANMLARTTTEMKIAVRCVCRELPPYIVIPTPPSARSTPAGAIGC